MGMMDELMNKLKSSTRGAEAEDAPSARRQKVGDNEGGAKGGKEDDLSHGAYKKLAEYCGMLLLTVEREVAALKACSMIAMRMDSAYPPIDTGKAKTSNLDTIRRNTKPEDRSKLPAAQVLRWEEVIEFEKKRCRDQSLTAELKVLEDYTAEISQLEPEMRAIRLGEDCPYRRFKRQWKGQYTTMYIRTDGIGDEVWAVIKKLITNPRTANPPAVHMQGVAPKGNLARQVEKYLKKVGASWKKPNGSDEEL